MRSHDSAVSDYISGWVRTTSTTTTTSSTTSTISTTSTTSTTTTALELSCGLDPPWATTQEAEPQRVAVVLRGEIFRAGPLAENIEQRKRAQLECSRSQLEQLVLPFEQRGFTVDVFSATYSVEPHFDTQSVLKVFGSRVCADERVKWPGSQGRTYARAINGLVAWAYAKHRTYRFIAIVRHDLCLKVNMTELLLNNPGAEKRIFSLFPLTRLHRSFPECGTDAVQFVPMKFLGCFHVLLRGRKPRWAAEASVRDIVLSFNGTLSYTRDTGFLLEWFGGSTPQTFSNPLYWMAGRPKIGRHYAKELNGNQTLIAELEQKAKMGRPPRHPDFGLFKCCKKMKAHLEQNCEQCPLWPAEDREVRHDVL
eukprot:gnl/TRDRNA2_/TRDRNA2_89824_c0_seq1.p1 gnl/TRDRNA2_/TRDRNA2_89824_c0~~gnl/TRDRNA2_/TRDRNA2_89824_c0_seq1.p1  ORF type:complete len:397 (+),score=36.66 gnl/TRDRNA2_/TRDRNA2_89824_c0_seq1:94-1191(+)